MSDQNQELNPAEAKTPLQQVQQENREHLQVQTDTTPEVVGQGAPSDRIHHPQRQLYDGKE